jgi:hypothetical protein
MSDHENDSERDLILVYLESIRSFRTSEFDHVIVKFFDIPDPILFFD